jgi:LmbE family N-acetylglucosaminyl deacetylase
LTLPPRVLFVGAHCDDIELFAGGLLFACCAANKDVGVLVFSDHRGVVDEATATKARSEFAANVAWLRVETNATLRDHTGPMLRACRGDFEAKRGDLHAALESLRDSYDLVVTHASGDTNQDHHQVHVEAVRVFKAHASVWGGEFPSNDLGGFRPQIFVALAERALTAKSKMIERYESQKFGQRPYLDGNLAHSLAHVRGGQIQEKFAEAFEIAGRTIVRAL